MVAGRCGSVRIGLRATLQTGASILTSTARFSEYWDACLPLAGEFGQERRLLPPWYHVFPCKAALFNLARSGGVLRWCVRLVACKLLSCYAAQLVSCKLLSCYAAQAPAAARGMYDE